MLALVFCALAQRAGAAIGASVPWITYEAENMFVSGGSILGPTYDPGHVTTEASGRMCVRLNAPGQFIQFTNQTPGTSLVVRYCVPDTSDGVGADYTLSLYTNGALAATLPVTSKYSWLYGNYPFSNNPAYGFPRNFFDEGRINGLNLAAGCVVRLQKNSTDSAAYYDIDLVDVENVPAALAQPTNSISVTNYGAVGDGATDCTAAFQNCMTAARSQNKSAWIPPGNFLITGTINLSANTQITGAGMWYSTLVGNPTLYTNQSRRVNLSGSGSNIKLADFAILGRLNYRNDSEGNDGLGGSFGTGSSISRIWVEHTKAAAWIYNSSGLVVDGCRFRDTLADGINVNYAMQNTVVTNCATRGTGDDCFAIWPSPNSGNYTPANNVFTHCTGELPFLANGGAIYGGANNRIENSVFSDISYGCGILFSTTFNVSFTFGGTNVAQYCDLIRCGGYDGGYGWRSAVQIVMDNTNYKGISGLDLNNLNLMDTISSGVSILGSAGGLSNATATAVNIEGYDLGNISGQNAWWARCLNGCPNGSLIVSNSVVPEFEDDSGAFNFSFISNAVGVSVQANVPGGSYLVDDVSYTNVSTFAWAPGSSHSVGASNILSAGSGAQYVWNSWSDGGSLTHDISPTTTTNFTVNFTTQYFLNLNSGVGGTVSPASMWGNSGQSINISATPSNGFAFGGWAGSGFGSYSGGSDPATITLNGPVNEQAIFLPPSPMISGVAVNGSNGIVLTCETEPGFVYHLETTSRLDPPLWIDLFGSTNKASNNLTIFADTNLPSGARYYRTVSP